MKSDQTFELRAKSARGRSDRVSQAMGVRQACLALLPLSTPGEMRDAIYELGRKADEMVKANDGMYFADFDKCAADRLAGL